jgi:glycosyltransferase involved in cell wall biosynthesis
MTIHLLGRRNILGGGIHYSNFCDALLRTNLLAGMVKEWDMANSKIQADHLALAQKSDINIFFFGFNPHIYKNHGFNVVWAIFETDTLADVYIESIKRADLIWVPSQWGKEVLLAHDIAPEKIDVIPEGVDPSAFHPYLRPSIDTSDQHRKFRYLMLGKYEERKGYRQLFEAFKLVQDAGVNAELIIKADYFINQSKKHDQLIADINALEMKNVRLLQGQFSQQDLLALYSSVHSFVFPARAEGWGLPLIEAIASGLPALATNYSGHTEFLSKIPGLYSPIKYDLVPIEDPEFQSYWPSRKGSWGRWAEADIHDLAKKMTDLAKHYPKWQKKALGASDVIRSQFSWDAARDKALSSLIQRGLLPKISVQMASS